ncbi:tRNA lysidine(34) synthetase TilS, partial [Bacteroides caccae]|uniref:tRNA lysidine(34) synthetase TilS n=3 Tax=Pseudomonadati TaxID=3379134 RepID=UPI001F01DBE7
MEGCRVIACHVHHGLRLEADEEAQFVREYAASTGVPCVWRRADVAGMARVQGISTEEAARKTRQNLFLEWAAEYPGALVALAHHRNDQQETALLHLCRGASGIHGMSPVSIWENGLTVVRPLLNFSRKEITAYLEEKNIPWREDASNQSTEYTRNALRHHIIPHLDKIFRRDTSLSF